MKGLIIYVLQVAVTYANYKVYGDESFLFWFLGYLLFLTTACWVGYFAMCIQIWFNKRKIRQLAKKLQIKWKN